MSDKPIIFSAPMIRALLDGKKTQTRRMLKPQPDYRGGYGCTDDHEEWGWENEDGSHLSVVDIAPNGYRKGDRLYVREAHALVPASAYRMSEGVQQAINPSDKDRACIYRAGWDRCIPRWRPSIHMPRWASRLTLTVTDVRVQRLHEITSADAIAEGCRPHANSMSIDCDTPDPRDDFRNIWNSIHGADAWVANPWVAAIRFTVHKGNIDRVSP